MREQAKKPFRMLSAVVLMFALPHWYSIATSNMATAVPAYFRPHIAHHFEEIGNGVVDNLIQPFEHGVPNRIAHTRTDKVDRISNGTSDARNDIS